MPAILQKKPKIQNHRKQSPLQTYGWPLLFSGKGSGPLQRCPQEVQRGPKSVRYGEGKICFCYSFVGEKEQIFLPETTKQIVFLLFLLKYH